jgi:Tol biopolymer transport system component
MRTTIGLVLAISTAIGVGIGCSAGTDHTFDTGGGGPGGDNSSTTTGPGSGGSVPAGTLTIKPNPIDVTIKGADVATPITTTSNTDGDVTTAANYVLDDPTLATVSGGKVVVKANVDHGGKTVIHASYGPNGIQSGTADLIVHAHGVDIVDPSAPMNPGTYFGVGGGAAPSWVYPFDRTMLPRNQPELAFQLQGTGNAQAYRIRLEGQYFSRDIYFGPTKCAGSNCTFQLSDVDWTSVAHAFAGQDVKATVSASAGPNGPAGDSAPIQLSFSPEDVLGGVYYWSTTITGIYRVPLGAKTATTFIQNGNEFGCAGCHAVSRDGKKVALEFGSADGVGGGIVDGANGTQYIVQPPNAGQWNLQSFSPDGKMLIVNWMRHAKVIDATTGQLLFDVPDNLVGGGGIAQPEWSPDGKSIVFTRYPADGNGDEWFANNTGDIMTMPFNNGQFGAPQMIVQSKTNQEYHFYPSWTPDSKWIVFNTGTVPCGGFGGGGCNNYDAQNTRLRMVQAMGGAMPIDLTRATHALSSTTNWPRVAPFIQAKGSLVFFTFSSKFPYGFKGQGGNPQLWMAAIDLAKAQANPADDPSYAPFWLTFQNPMESNHLATWTESVNCNDNTDCPGGFHCDMGNCVSDEVPK